MKMPGYSAEASLETTGGYHRTAHRDHNQRRLGVIPQLKAGVFHRPRLGRVFGTIEDYYSCKQGCEAAHSACLATCEGTWANPQPSSNCTLCDQDYNACMQGCSRDIA